MSACIYCGSPPWRMHTPECETNRPSFRFDPLREDTFMDDMTARAEAQKPRLPTDAAARKAIPLATGLLDYFPNALAAVAALSKKANEQHNPGKPMRWDRSKSGDEADTLMRHLAERGTVDTDGMRHSAKVAWRALALLQKELEEAEGLPISPGSVSGY